MTERPRPPALLLEPAAFGEFLPAPELAAWIAETFIDPGGPLVNSDHAHLIGAQIGVLWTSEPARSKQLDIAATAEIPFFRGSAWVKARQEFQLREWFEAVPDFVLTFYAPYANAVDHATWCALVEHELYHCAQEIDRWGMPKFHRDGSPKYAIRGHDVEEFVGVVRRYGAGAAAGATELLVAAARKRPEVAEAQMSAACGVCLKAA